jgi:hypothetical protein
LADRTGERLTQAVIAALRERLERNRPAPDDDDLVEDVLKLADRFLGSECSMRAQRKRFAGYDERGAPRIGEYRR